jgi:catechol 2,3-dioxygenase-like lactoylglutathione lyase family enzyme
MRPIASLVGITLDTPRLEAMADFYEAAFGLARASGDTHEVALNGEAGSTAQLRLRRALTRGLVELRFAMRSKIDVDTSAAALSSQGVGLVEPPADANDGYGFAIRDPDGTKLRFSVQPEPSREAPVPRDRPLFVSHVVLNSLDPARLVDFYVDVLGFAVSDAYEKGLLTLLRCDQPQHHCIGIAPGETVSLNHFAMDCGNLDALMRSVGRMQRLGHSPVWGPGRHGPGGNIFCYYQDPDENAPEFTCDVLQIADPQSWQPKEWARTAANGNTWGTGGPTPRAVELMNGSANVAPPAK